MKYEALRTLNMECWASEQVSWHVCSTQTESEDQIFGWNTVGHRAQSAEHTGAVNIATAEKGGL